MKRTRCLLVGFFVFSAFNLAACGGSSSSPDGSSTVVAGASVAPGTIPGYSGTGPAIVQVIPAAGSYSAMPNEVQVTFNETELNPMSVQSTNNWTWACSGASAYPATNVSYNATTGVASIGLPFISGIAQGATCTLTASNSIVDQANNLISGTTATVFTLSSGSGLPQGFTYTPTSYPTVTVQVGGTGGSAFTENAASGDALAGFEVRSSSTINQIVPVWSPNYGVTSSINENINGGTYGGTGGTQGVLACPGANYRVVGIYGYAGVEDYTNPPYVNELGVLCQAQDGSSSAWTYSSTVGEQNGQYFYLTCPAGTYVTSISGRSGSDLDALAIGCQ